MAIPTNAAKWLFRKLHLADVCAGAAATAQHGLGGGCGLALQHAHVRRTLSLRNAAQNGLSGPQSARDAVLRCADKSVVARIADWQKGRQDRGG